MLFIVSKSIPQFKNSINVRIDITFRVIWKTVFKQKRATLISDGKTSSTLLTFDILYFEQIFQTILTTA